MTAGRDIQLDMYRGLAMIYILCVIHVAYWLGLAGEPWRSIILFEMPLIFFISGASVSVASRKHDVGGTVWNRFKRVLLPYYSYIFYSVILVCVAGVLSYAVRGGAFDVGLSAGMLMRTLIPRDEVLNIPYMYHLWFIVPYLIISCAFPFFRRAVDRVSRTVVVAILLSSCVVAQLTDSGTLKEIVVYNFFFVIGYLFYRRMKTRNIVGAFVTSVLLLVIYVMGGGKEIVPMQAHKFPPDLIFMMYGVAVLSGLGIVFTYVKLPYMRALGIWNKRGYTLYLWQNYFFAVVAILAGKAQAMLHSGNGMGLFITCSLLIFAGCTVFSGLLVRMEGAFTGLFDKVTGRVHIKFKSAARQGR